jgi:hypothetical protein
MGHVIVMKNNILQSEEFFEFIIFIHFYTNYLM